jgi:hypothetical protein
MTLPDWKHRANGKVWVNCRAVEDKVGPTFAMYRFCNKIFRQEQKNRRNARKIVHTTQSEIATNQISTVKELYRINLKRACFPLQGCQSTIHDGLSPERRNSRLIVPDFFIYHSSIVDSMALTLVRRSNSCPVQREFVQGSTTCVSWCGCFWWLVSDDG